MVFRLHCFSFRYVIEDNTSDDRYYTAFPDFAPGSQTCSHMNPGSIMSVFPSLDARPGTLRSFTLAELNTATSDFNLSSKIGEGGFGSVHLGVVKSLENPIEDVSVAVKRGKKGSQAHNQWMTEVNVLRGVEHPNLVKLVGHCAEGDDRLLVYEYMPNRSLDDCLSAQSDAHLSWPMRLKIAQGAASGLTYLHRRQIIFRDFKPSNILLDDQCNAKLSDFGFAREGPLEGGTHVSTKVVGTKGYGAPEYAQTGRLTYKSDVWSYGVFLVELITGTHPLPQNNSNNEHGHMGWLKCCYSAPQKPNLIIDSRLAGKYSQRSVEELSIIANKCLAKNPKLRPKMSEVLQMVNNIIAFEDTQFLNGGHT